MQVPLRKKIVIGLLICSGFFVIAAAIIRVVLTLGANPSGTNINRWGVRETIVGIISVNIPILRPLFTKAFWKDGTMSLASAKFNSTGNTRTLPEGRGPYEMAGSISDSRKGRKRLSFGGGSEEFIIDKDDLALKPTANDVVVHTTYHVRSEELSAVSPDIHGTSSKVTVFRGSDSIV